MRASPFLKNISIVMSGTVIAQLIGFASLPVISRLFTASEFGVYGSFISVVGVAGAGVTLQYSQAIMLPLRDEDAVNIFTVSILSVFFITLITLVLTLIFSEWLLSILKAPQTKWLLWFLPLGIMVSGLNQSFQAWCVRRKAFKKTAYSQMIRAGAVNTLQIVSGLLRNGSGGLIASSITADGLATISLSRQVFGTDKCLFSNSISWNRIRKLAVEYRDFPFFSATQKVMNSLSQGLPVLLLSHFFGIATAGSYAFGVRIFQAPMNFVLTALRQVLFQKASETFNHGGSLIPLFVKTTLGLLAIVIIPAVILIIWAPQIFIWLFGSAWGIAGEYARWLFLWLSIGFVNVPAVLFARIYRKQATLLIQDILLLLFRCMALVIGGFYLSALDTVITYSIVGMCFNIFIILWMWRVLKMNANKIER
jgi:O-antigen/teichoic acid export membrane protein